MGWSRIAADLVLIFHTSFIAFVVLGLVLTWVGYFLNWEWTRRWVFRSVHLAAIGYVVLQSYLGIICPLTDLENHLRLRAGQDPYGDAGFIAYWLHRVIFFTAPSWVFTLCYTLFGLLVVGTLVLAPPRRKKKDAPVADDPAPQAA
jgi:hypothetical protein